MEIDLARQGFFYRHEGLESRNYKYFSLVHKAWEMECYRGRIQICLVKNREGQTWQIAKPLEEVVDLFEIHDLLTHSDLPARECGLALLKMREGKSYGRTD